MCKLIMYAYFSWEIDKNVNFLPKILIYRYNKFKI